MAADFFSSAFAAVEEEATEVEYVSAAVVVVFAEVRARLAGGAWDAVSSSSSYNLPLRAEKHSVACFPGDIASKHTWIMRRRIASTTCYVATRQSRHVKTKVGERKM